MLQNATKFLHVNIQQMYLFHRTSKFCI